MEKKLFVNMVQKGIGYYFNNIDLLHQAFTRRSYSEENGGENNEVLEFIGDKALDFAVVKILITKFGEMQHRKAAYLQENSNYFSCTCDENELTKIKSRMVQKKNLAKRIDELGFAGYLRMGNSDCKNDIANEPSVKEDLFEAIIGAVTLDCGWDFNKIQSVVEAMLIPEDFLETDEDDNYVRMIYDWEAQENNCQPWFWFEEQSYTSSWYIREPGVIYQEFPLFYDYTRLKHLCKLKLLNEIPVFCGFGASKSEARMNVCKLAYDWLHKNDYICESSIRDEIENPNKDDAINQLEILARRGYFSIPIYNFEEKYDKNGNPVWKCECHIEEEEYYFDATSSSKKDAKKSAAFDMLMYVLEYEKGGRKNVKMVL